MPARFQMRKGTAAQWTAANPTLLNGEPGAETDTKKLKVGDGVTAWNSLAYIGGSGGGVTDGDYGDITVSSSGTVWTVDASVLSPYLTTASAAATYQTLDADLTALAALSGTNDIYYRSGAATWSPVTIGTGIGFSGGTLTASASGGPVPGIDPRSALYSLFTPSGIDDEFNDGSFSGWTAVNDGVTVPTVTEAYDRVSIMHPGGGAAARLCAYMKTQTPATNSMIEIGFTMMGRGQSFNICGLIFADGNTYNAGTQVVWYLSPQETQFVRGPVTGYNATTGMTGLSSPSRTFPRINLLRFKYEGSNNWSGWTSCDGQQWTNVTGTFARTLSPTHVGFFVTTWGGAAAHNFVLDYFRYIP